MGQLRGLVVKLGAQRVLQELLEAEQREFLGADRDERSAAGATATRLWVWTPPRAAWSSGRPRYGTARRPSSRGCSP